MKIEHAFKFQKYNNTVTLSNPMFVGGGGELIPQLDNFSR